MAAALSQLPPFAIVAAYALFWSWEGLSSARPRAAATLPHRRARNIGLTIITIVILALAGTALLGVSAAAEFRHWGLLSYAGLPGWAGVVIGILALDVADYWRHRASHFVPILWRLHRVHHSDAAMDVTTSFRSHPVEFVIRAAIFAAVVIVVGVPVLALLIAPLVQIPVLVFQHANVRLPKIPDRLLSLLIVTPTMHLVHHSRLEPQTNSNYTTFLTIWDHVFGSFRGRAAPEGIGLNGLDELRYQSLTGMLLTPWR